MIVIPMAGLSSRFARAGYDRPKYMLPLGPRTVFDHAVGSFTSLFETVPFLFVARDVMDTAAFVERSCRELGVRDARLCLLTEPTSGQAETVELGLLRSGVADTAAVTIFNIDTFRPGFTFPADAWFAASDGYLEVFRGSGANWSYVRPSADTESAVLETAEKRPISDLCCTGLYHFARAGDFHAALALERVRPSQPELYVAPLYNHLLASARHVHYRIVPESEIVFCGVPSEYEALLAARAIPVAEIARHG